MKKLFAVLALVAIVAMMFAGCSGAAQTGNCDLCGQENVSVRGITVEGETGYFCDSCYDTAKAMADMYNSGALDGLM